MFYGIWFLLILSLFWLMVLGASVISIHGLIERNRQRPLRFMMFATGFSLAYALTPPHTNLKGLLLGTMVVILTGATLHLLERNIARKT